MGNKFKLMIAFLAIGIQVAVMGQHATVQLKLFLQGPYAGNEMMHTHLNNLIPLQHPYQAGVWQYDGDEQLSSIPSGMVDWILVELRSHSDTARARKAAVLYSDGTVKDVHDSLTITFSLPAGDYHVAILHRSHLPMMSQHPLSLPSTSLLDFSDSTVLSVHGSCHIHLGGGVMGMIAGDLNHDNILKYSGSGNDRSLVLQRILAEAGGTAINAIVQGYFKEDIRMDGVVKYSGAGNDPSLIIQNLVTLTGSTAINATFQGSVPYAVYAPPIFQTFHQCGDILTDLRDGQQYPTVEIASQCWMARNLNIGNMVQDHATANPHTHASNNGIIEKYCYNNDPQYCQQMGGLYSWNEMMDYSTAPGASGICPDGWHVPTDAEWCVLSSYVDSTISCASLGLRGIDGGGKLKEAGLANWSSPNTGATNAYGFTALGAGARSVSGGFSSLQANTFFWTSSIHTNNHQLYRYMGNTWAQIGRYFSDHRSGYSVRCMLTQAP